MLGSLIFWVLILVELGLAVFAFMKKSTLKREKAITRIVLFIIFLLLLISPVIDGGFSWFMLGLLLGIQAFFGVQALVRKKRDMETKRSKVVFGFVARALLIGMAVLPVILFPQHDPIKTTGTYAIATKSLTLTDQARKETFTKDPNDNRKVTIQFWYPAKTNDKFPLVVFSHGAFGLRTSNYSTYQELASNGYVVVSIDHPYHSFFTKQTDGKVVIADMDFVNNAMKAQNGDMSAKEIYNLEQEWMKVRTADMTFVLDYIKNKAGSDRAIFRNIDLEHIGVFGHSLGGATAAAIGREDKDIDAVIVIDGTMLGEVTGFKDGKELVTNEPYPKPILNFFSESHYKGAVKAEDYANTVVHKNGVDSHQVIIKGSEHMNFADLPIVSPYLAGMLGTGTVDSRKCIEMVNKTILQFFDHYLKSSNIDIPKKTTL